jgi:signal transduction histidine kinase
MDRLPAVVRSPTVLAGTALSAVATVALIGYLNMPPDPGYVTVDRYGFGELDIAREMLPGLAFGIAGLMAWRRRPHNRIGPLMVLIGVAILLKGFQGIPIPPAVSLGIWASIGPGVLPAILLGVLVLAYPTGRLSSRIGRWWAAAAALFFFTVQLGWALFTPTTTDSTKCADCYPAFILGYDEYVRFNLRNLNMLIFAVLAVILVVLVARRWHRATSPTRRVMAPIWLAGSVVVVVALSSSILSASIRLDHTFGVHAIVPSLGNFLIGRIPFTMQDLLPWIVSASMLLVPAALMGGVMRSHLSLASVSALAIELGRPPHMRPPLLDSLRHALGDRSLDLVLWSRPIQAYVTPNGRPVESFGEDRDRAVTLLVGDDGPLAALAHDRALGEQRQVLDGVAAVARMAIENVRLHAEVEAQLAEVRASRQRIVSAADDERRRVERNIHDGAQQRLVTLSMALRLAQSRAADASPDVAATLADAEVELKQAIGELRELARGIHPAILTEAGLGPALDSLAEQAPLPVAVDTRLNERLSPLVEATAYFVVAEALTNVARHAAATTATVRASVADGVLSLRIADDGDGGADPMRGTGIRGLSDRLAALGGSLRISDAPDGGTRLEAEIPCASA